MQIEVVSNPLCLVLVFLALIYAFLSVFWIKKSFKRKYRDSLTKKEQQHLQAEIDTLKQEKEKLFEENRHLASIIHKDNKLMDAMLLSVKQMGWQVAGEQDPARRQDLCDQIISHLEENAGNRADVVRTYEHSGHQLPKTGCSRIDSLITYMDQKAFSHRIRFECTLGPKFMKSIENVISTEDLETLLADLLENAIIATKNQEKRSILLFLDHIDDVPMLAVYDSGVPFPEEVRAARGTCQLTTHADSGGSGIGMVSTHRICQDCGAQFDITDCEPGMPYTKRISVAFSKCPPAP